MDEKEEEQNGTRLHRRKFLGALGAAATAGTILQRGGENARADETTVYFEDSFGNIVPVSSDALAAGVPLPILVPEQIPPSEEQRRKRPPGHRRLARGSRVWPESDSGGGSCGTATTHVSSAYPQPDILLIMVDQMRAPRWLTSSQRTTVNTSITPNIHNLQQQSFVFAHYFAAATNCSPSRATLLTGLYSQQTCMFVTASAASTTAPTLNTGYPTIGTVLSQSFVGYDTAWIGKWHVSDLGGDGNGPMEYGFTNAQYCIPNPNSGSHYSPTVYPSPTGLHNEGNGGAFLDGSQAQSTTTGYGLSSPTFPCETGYSCPYPPPPSPPQKGPYLNDFAIYNGFQNWLNAQTEEPWFCGVSFIGSAQESDDLPERPAFSERWPLASLRG